MSPPAKNARVAGHHVRVNLDYALFDRKPGHLVEQRQIHVLAQREDQRVGLDGFEFAGRLRKALVVEHHFFDGERGVLDARDGIEPLHHDAFLERFLQFEVVRRHLLARAPVDDDRFGRAQAFGRARDIERGVAAAVDHDAAPELRPLAGFHAAQHAHCIENARGVARRNFGALRDMRADREERGIEAALFHRVQDVVDARVELERDAHVENALDFGIEHVARQPVLRDAETHHAAGQRTGFMDRHLVAEPRQVIRGRQPGRAGADHQHVFAGGLRRDFEFPAVLARLIAEKPLDGMDVDRCIELAAVADVLAGVIADATHQRGHRIVFVSSCHARW